jgi:serine/threonine protein kinase
MVVSTFSRIRYEEVFERELDAPMRFDHMRVVPLFGCVLRVGRDGPKIVTNFMGSDPLAKALRSSPTWLTATVKTIVTVATVVGMIEVHETCFIHHDRTPLTIVLDGNHRPRICDFGSSRHVMLSQTMTYGVRTMSYMTPELFRNADHTNRADVCSFARICYEVIAGQPVFGPDMTAPGILDSQTKGDPIANPVDAEGFVGDLLHRGWLPTCEERPFWENILDYGRC